MEPCAFGPLVFPSRKLAEIVSPYVHMPDLHSSSNRYC
jgi:hypothetical protein